MPALPDKVELNTWDFDADSYSMMMALEGAAHIGNDIIEIGKLLNPSGGGIIGNKLLAEDGKQHLVEQESICEELHKALANCIKRQRELNDKRRKWLDAEIAKL